MATLPLTQTSEKLLTAEEFMALGNLDSCELIEGVIVPMSPTSVRHPFIESNVAGELRAFVQQNDLGYVGAGEAGILIQRNPDTIRGADVLFISKEQYQKSKARSMFTAL
ncbi:MAG: Uma2 family endonuclease [Chloroflexi bacterium]|nr:Uma2 family endonuclease [Chloroflexota bacterium]MCI0575243.1 Uma2 family endonuclease [Chloroflexota bacterium]MCI0648836.1 Uma2 family endonuclease [Chloroflexota bacterium]MCI0726591.1 Uma2 family endonuclease [Chloroflexota bacterium]